MTGGAIYAALAAIFTVLIGVFGWIMRRAGKDAVNADKGKTNEKINAIGNEKPDLNSSLDRLRKRANKPGPK